MALVVEDGSIVSGANSFLSAADAEAIFTELGLDLTAWSALSLAAQEAAVLRAARHLEAVYGPRFKGIRQVRGQTMSWPRKEVYGLDGFEVTWGTIIDEVKWAQAHLTYATIDGTDLLQDVAVGDGNVTLTRDKVGELEQEKRYSSGASSTQKRFSYVDAVLAPYLIGGPGIGVAVRS